MQHLIEQASAHLQRLCVEIDGRSVGSPGNRAATDYFAGRAAAFGLGVSQPEFDCLNWSGGEARLEVGGAAYALRVSPYSLGCQVSAPLAVAASLPELEQVDAGGRVLLVRGELAREQLMPKNFPFYNPAEHQRILHLLEARQPLAVLAATSRDPALAGALYPFPLIEDGDFDIPSGYLTDTEGLRLAAQAGQTAVLSLQAERRPATGCNVIARGGAPAAPRVVLFAHIDAKAGTPGALDNAAGVVVLLLLAELLRAERLQLGVEIVALNGEDDYANPGERQYLALNAGRFDEIALGINLDGLGYIHGGTAYSLYECPPDLAGRVRKTFAPHPHLLEGEPWVQGDHFLFLMNQRPALAITSERVAELLTEIVHTARDRVEMVDPARLALTALALRDLLLRLGRPTPADR